MRLEAKGGAGGPEAEPHLGWENSRETAPPRGGHALDTACLRSRCPGTSGTTGHCRTGTCSPGSEHRSQVSPPGSPHPPVTQVGGAPVVTPGSPTAPGALGVPFRDVPVLPTTRWPRLREPRGPQAEAGHRPAAWATEASAPHPWPGLPGSSVHSPVDLGGGLIEGVVLLRAAPAVETELAWPWPPALPRGPSQGRWRLMECGGHPFCTQGYTPASRKGRQN